MQSQTEKNHYDQYEGLITTTILILITLPPTITTNTTWTHVSEDTTNTTTTATTIKDIASPQLLLRFSENPWSDHWCMH